MKEQSLSMAADAKKMIPKANKAVMESSGRCTTTFDVVQGWNATTTTGALKAVLDQSGLVGAVCFHGIGLRF
jgi:hypothetical protein